MRTKPFEASTTTYVIIIAFVVLIILLIVFRNKIQGWIAGPPVAATLPPATAGTTTLPAAVGAEMATNIVKASAGGLDMNLHLGQGSTGPEVIQLQKWLGFFGNDLDGKFGPKTQNALLQTAGVTSTTLATFYSTVADYKGYSDNPINYAGTVPASAAAGNNTGGSWFNAILNYGGLL